MFKALLSYETLQLQSSLNSEVEQAKLSRLAELGGREGEAKPTHAAASPLLLPPGGLEELQESVPS